jgi:hypothetical protein
MDMVLPFVTSSLLEINPLYPIFIYITFKYSVLSSNKTEHVSVKVAVGYVNNRNLLQELQETRKYTKWVKCSINDS